MDLFYEKFNQLLSLKTPFVKVILVDSIGSCPQSGGSKMLVTEQGLYTGTIGGGKLEYKAIKTAQQFLANTAFKSVYVEWNLKKDVEMSCGGIAKIYFERFSLPVWKIAVFGAGHVANALIPLLLPLDCQIRCIDPRAQWLNKLPSSPKLLSIQTEEMASEVRSLDPATFVLLMTMGHSTDLPILIEILKNHTFPYLGVIGSRAKALALKKEIELANLPSSCKEAFYCPVGLKVGGHHPHEIAISIIAQLLQERDRFQSMQEGCKK